jgi:hypothetical protein
LHSLDGLIFPSVQLLGESNVVLFHNAARVEGLALPEGTEIDASLYEMSDDGPEVDYSVIEWVPPRAALEKEEAASKILRGPRLPLPEIDVRDVTLRIDVDHLQVRHVNSVTFTTNDHPVARYRYEEKGTSRKF